MPPSVSAIGADGPLGQGPDLASPPAYQNPIPDPSAKPTNVLPFNPQAATSQPVQTPVQPALQQEDPSQAAQSRLLAPVPTPATGDLPLQPHPEPEQLTRNLMDVVSNPLNIPLPARKPIQAPVDHTPGPVTTFQPPDQPRAVTQPEQAAFVPPDAPNELQAQSGFQPPDAPKTKTQISDIGFNPPPEQNYRIQNQQAEALSTAYDHDPKRVMEAYSGDNSIPLSQVVQAVQYAQQKDEAKDDWAKIQDDYINGAKTVGGWILGAAKTLANPLAIPAQIGSTIDTAKEAIAPFATGTKPLQEEKTPTGPVSAIGAPGTPLASSDIVRPHEAPIPAQVQLEQQRAQRELVAGGQLGPHDNFDMVQAVINSVLGVAANNPIAGWVRAMGGPRPGVVIDPQKQISLLMQKVPIPWHSAQDVHTMDPDQLIAEAIVRRFEANYRAQQQAGYVTPSGESLLDLFAGGKAKSPEELDAGGYGVRPQKVEDVAGTVNTALSVPEFAVLDAVLGATGAKSLLERAAGRGLQGVSVIPRAAGEVVAAPFDLVEAGLNRAATLAPKSPRGVGLAALEGTRAVIHAVTGIDLPLDRGIVEWYAAEPIGKLLTPAASGALNVAGKGIGWGSKVVRAVAEPVADWLDTAGADMANRTNLLATRSPIGNLVGKTLQNVARGVAETLPVAVAANPDQPEAAGGFMGYGILGHELHRILPDISDTARNTVADHLFVRDPNKMRGTKVADPISYGTRPDLDAKSLAEINSTRTVKIGLFGGTEEVPIFSDAQKQTFHNTRAAVNGAMEIHLLSPSDYAAEISRLKKTGVLQDADVNSRGVAIDTGPDTQPRVLVRSDAFSQAFEHEISHPVVNRMTPDEQRIIFDLYARKNNPDMFVKRYTRDAVTSLSDLPTEAGIKDGTQKYVPGWEGLTQEDAKREFLTEAVSSLFKGDTVSSFTRNPTLIRSAQMALGSILGRWGFDPTTTRSLSVSGVQPSLPTAVTLDAIVRDALHRNMKLAPPKAEVGAEAKTADQAAKPAEAVTGPSEADIKGLMAKGFTRDQAVDTLNKAAGQGSKTPFVPSGQWQEVPDWAAVPQGGEYRVNMATGKTEARWDKPPGPETVVDKRTGKAQSATESTQPPKSTPAEIAKRSLRDFQGFSQEEVDRHVPADAPNAMAAIQTARAAILAERAKSGAKPGVTPVVSGQGPTVPSQTAPGTQQTPQTSQSASPTQNAPVGQPGASNAPAQQQQAEKPSIETTEQSAPLQQHLRSEGATPGEAQSGVLGAPRVERGIPRAPLARKGRGNIGAYGYAGDATPDTNSLRGIGAFPHTSKPGSLIDGYSAALTRAGAAKRGVLPGQEFIGEDGRTYRWDDVAPDYAKGHKVPDDYIDVYSPRHEADPGVSAEQIARNQAIMAGVGIGSSGKRGPLTAGEQPKGPISLGQSVVEKSVTGQTAQQPSAEIPKVSAPAGIPSSGRIAEAETAARAEIPQGRRSDESYQDAIRQRVVDVIGPAHAASLDPTDSRVKYDPTTGFLSGQYIDPKDAFHEWLLRQTDYYKDEHLQAVVKQIEDAIKNRSDLNVDYGSAPQKPKGLPTAEQRAKAQAESSAAAREKGLADIQVAGKNIQPNGIGISLGAKGEPASIYYYGLSPDKIAGNAQNLVHRLASESPYKGAPPGDPVAEEDWRGYTSNLANSWKGTGKAKLEPTEGVRLPREKPGFEPYKMSQAKSDFWNLSVTGGSSKLSTKEMAKGAETSAGRAAMLAEANQGFLSPEGHVNRLAQKIESETPGWAKQNLHSGFETLKASLTRAIHKSGELESEHIHPGHPAIAKGLSDKGSPSTAALKAGFLPAKTEGEAEPITTAKGRTTPAVPSNEDRKRKLSQRIDNIQRAQEKLDLTKAEDDQHWHRLSKKIHALEMQHDRLTSEESNNGQHTSESRTDTIHAGDFHRKTRIKLSRDSERRISALGLMLGPKHDHATTRD